MFWEDRFHFGLVARKAISNGVDGLFGEMLSGRNNKGQKRRNVAEYFASIQRNADCSASSSCLILVRL